MFLHSYDFSTHSINAFSFHLGAVDAESLAPVMQPYWVSEQGFRDCDLTAGRPIIATPTNTVFMVPSEYLRPGKNYFIGKSIHYAIQFIVWNIFNCSYEIQKAVAVNCLYKQGSILAEKIRYFMYNLTFLLINGIGLLVS